MSEAVKGRAWNGNRPNFDRNLAVVIGIDRYENDSIRNLSTAVSDAGAIANLLEQQYAYKQTDKQPEVIRLFDEEATLDALKHLFHTRIPNELNPGEGDRLIIYYAGHGLPRSNDDGPEGYLVPYNADPTKPELFLAMRDVSEALSKLKCHHLLVILDCCFAGTFRWAGSRKAVPILETIRQEHYYHFIRHPAWQVITSSAYDQEALDVARLKEDNRKPVPGLSEPHSPFALAILEGLQTGDDSQRANADLYPDGVVTAHELFVYLQNRVKELSGERQNPGIFPLRQEYDKGEFIFTRPEFDPQNLAKALPLNEDNNPYRGLNSFDEKHARFFFGRQVLIEELAKRLAQPNQALTVVLGVSGSGKSSLVKAGLIPYLRDQHLVQICLLERLIQFPPSPLKLRLMSQIYQWCILDPMRPGEFPFMSLARTLLPIANNNLLERLAEVSFLDDIFQPMLKSKAESGRDSDNLVLGKQVGKPPATQPSPQTDETLMKVADSWCSATPEGKLLLIEDYFAQLETLGNPQQKDQLKELYDRILAELDVVSQQLQQEPQYFSHAISTWSQKYSGTQLLLVIDQFEELLTRSQDDRESPNQTEQQENNLSKVQKEWQKFLEVLRIAIAEQSQTLRLVLTLRSDFEPRFLTSTLEPYWKDARFPVRAMISDELRQAIENPALKQAIYFEELKDDRGNTTGNLVSKLVDEVGQMPGALPLLSFTLSELYVSLYKRWQVDQSTDRTLRFADYDALGGVAGALTRRATEEYGALDEKHQATMRRVMLRMVVIEGGGVLRRRVPMDELKYSFPDENARVTKVIECLINARLIVIGQEINKADAESVVYVEPAHDFLITGWDKLQDWVKEEQESLTLQKRLTPAANDWVRDKGGLWSREIARLAQLEKLLKSRNSWLNKVEVDFVDASKRQRLDELEEAKRQRDEAIRGQVDALNSLSEANYFQNDHLGALVASVKAGKILQSQKEISLPVISKFRTVLKLHQAVYGAVEHNKFEGGTNNECSINFSPDGNLVAFATIDGTIQIWNIDGFLEKTIPGHYKGAGARGASVNFNPDGKTFTSIYWAGGIQILDLNGLPYTCEEELFYPGEQSTDKKIIKLRYTTSSNAADYSTLTSIDWKQLWYKNSILRKIEIEHNNEVINTVCFSPDSRFLASASADKTVKLWKIDGTLLSTIQEHTNCVLDVVFSADGEKIASLASDSTVVVWNLNEGLVGKFNLTERNGHLGRVLGISFSFDGQALISASLDDTVKFWNTNGYLLKTKFWQGKGSTDISFSPNGKIFAATYNSGSVKLWSTEIIPPKTIVEYEYGFPRSIHKVKFSPNGKVIVGIVDKVVKVWNADGSFQSTLGNVGSSTSTNISFSKDSKVCSISADKYGIIGVYGSDGVFFSGDALVFPEEAYGCVSPDGKTIITVTGSIIKTWNFNGDTVNENLKVFEMDQSYNNLVDISFDGQVIAVASSEAVILLKVDGTSLKTIKTYGTRSISFSPNEQIIAVASADSMIKLYRTDNDSISPVQIFTGHTSVVKDVSFSPDGQFLASASMDETVKIWSLDDSLLQTLEGHTSYVNSVSFSPDAKTLASASSDGTIILWNLDLDKLLMLGCNSLDNFLKTNPKISPEDRFICSSS